MELKKTIEKTYTYCLAAGTNFILTYNEPSNGADFKIKWSEIVLLKPPYLAQNSIV